MIRVENLRCGYPDRPVLNDVSFTVPAGEFLGVLGPNGAGKTTLLLTLTGIIVPLSGSIEIMGESIERLKPRERARRMAAIAQNGDAALPFECEDIVRMGRYPHQQGRFTDNLEDETAVRRAMTVTDTETLARRLITEVSGGERQRVTVARALAQEAPLLLLDEATSAMDIHRKLQVFRVLERLNREEGLTVLAVLHDVNLAALFCRRLLFLKDGHIEADGPTETVLTPQVLERVYRTMALVNEIPGTGKLQASFLP